MTGHLALCPDQDHDGECQYEADITDDLHVVVIGQTGHLHTEVVGVVDGADQLARLVDTLTTIRDTLAAG